VTYWKACHSWDCIVTIHDCRVTYAEPAEKVSQIIEEASGSVWCKPTIKTTAFNLNVQAAR
jgi:hypothetical protein